MAMTVISRIMLDCFIKSQYKITKLLFSLREHKLKYVSSYQSNFIISSYFYFHICVWTYGKEFSISWEILGDLYLEIINNL